MLKKLIKYEYKALSRVMVPLLVCALGLSVLTAILLWTSKTLLLSTGGVSIAASMTLTLGTISMIFLAISIFGTAVTAFLLLMKRYYDNFFKDEGYLTFTLPVSMKDHVLAKFISASGWLLITGIVVYAGFAIIILFNSSESGEAINWNALNFNGLLITDYYDESLAFERVLYIILSVLTSVIGTMSYMLKIYMAITIGCIVAQKHKIISSVAILFGISIAQSFIFIDFARQYKQLFCQHYCRFDCRYNSFLLLHEDAQ